MIELGKFTIVSGQIIVGDPCYNEPEICVPAINGDWLAYIEKNERIEKLIVQHVLFDSIEVVNIDENAIGVDSGQAGVFDMSYYNDDTLVHNVSWLSEESPLVADQPWYSLVCDRTLAKPHAGIIPFGVVSSSGWGDGDYPVTLYKVDDKVIKVEIVFVMICLKTRCHGG